MSESTSFMRSVEEMRSILFAIESHSPALAADASEMSRQAALSEVARLARATSHLARSFDVLDIATLADALAESTGQPNAFGLGSRRTTLSPALVRDTLAYLRSRADALSAAELAEAPGADEMERHALLIAALRQAVEPPPASVSTPDTSGAHIGRVLRLSSPSELSLDELSLVQSFADADLRKRDAAADAALLARVAEKPAFLAQSASGGGIPVFGGMTADEFDEIPPEMKLIFVKESQGDLRDLGQFVMDFEERPDDPSPLARMGYLAHKLKGSAATMGFDGFATIATYFQDAVRAAQTRQKASDAVVLAGLGRFLEIFEAALQSAAALEEPSPQLVEDARVTCDALQGIQQPEGLLEPSFGVQPPVVERGGERSSAAHNALTMHVDTRKLDSLMNQLSALAANRGEVARNLGDLSRAQSEMQLAIARLREKSMQIADSHPLTYDNLASMARNGASAAQLDSTLARTVQAASKLSGPLGSAPSSLQLEQYTEMDAALRALTEVVADVTANYASLATSLSRLGQLTESQDGLTREIQGEAMGIRLGRLSELTPRLRIDARRAATDFGKVIEFDVQGDDIEIDRSLLEKLEQPLIQLVRNAVAHGIESPSERTVAGKLPIGKVYVRAFNVGSEVVIEVVDDGRGVNANLLIGAAMSAKLITPEEARTLSRDQAMEFMFQVGVSTSAATAGHVSALAGTGVGLADVERTIRALRGSIAMKSDLERGTTFEIRVPISLSILPILEVRAAGQAMALPFAMVDSTEVIEPGALRSVGVSESNGGVREWRISTPVPGEDGELSSLDMPAYALAEMLGFEQDAARLRRYVVVSTHGQAAALLVEAVGDGDVRDELVRPLPQRLQRRVVRGVIMRPEDGQVALLVDPHEVLAQRSPARVSLRTPMAHSPQRPPQPTVLVVDDSVTIRRTLEGMLSASGYKTSVAHDGYEALEMMENELPSIIILDVEMPRLSGFELLRIMRASPQYQQVRVAMLTSRAADKHRDYAMGAGADAYLVKPCPQDLMIQTIERLLKESESK